MYPFEGEAEERRALAWIVSQLNSPREMVEAGQREMQEDLKDTLNTQLEALKNGGAREEPEWYQDIWDKFIFAVSGVWIDEASETWNAPFEWGEWELESAQRLKLGYSPQLLHTTIPAGGGSATHAYSNPPIPIVWNLTPITQKGVTFYIGKAKIAEIDAVCSVPQLPAELDSEEAGLRVLDPDRGDQEWQRRVEARRILSIKNFIDDAGNIIANAAILYAQEHKAVSYTKAGRFTVDFKKFLKRSGKQWNDHTGKNDRRPVWLIDGQHRTRGLAQSSEGVELEIPIILFPPDFSLGQSAKIFAEINTLQKKLTPLHTLFMQHRFHIPSPIAKRDFRSPWSDDKPATYDSRANHLSYECAAYLTSNQDGPMRARIRILDQNAPRFPITQASQWVDFSRSWFLEGGPYAPGCPESEDDIIQEVEDYFRAFVATCNHSGWKDGRPRWASGAHNKGLVQRQGPSQALLKLYPTVWSLAKSGRGTVTEKKFAEILKPLRWVDWIDSRLLPIFGGSGERPRTALRVWMENAISHGRSYPLDEVMADDIHSKPGRGMLASPGPGTLDIKGARTWPTKSRPVTLVASQPANTLSGSRWSLHDSRRVDRSPTNPVVFARNNVAELTLHHAPWMDSASHIDVRVDWYNTVMPPGHAELRLKK